MKDWAPFADAERQAEDDLSKSFLLHMNFSDSIGVNRIKKRTSTARGAYDWRQASQKKAGKKGCPPWTLNPYCCKNQLPD